MAHQFTFRQLEALVAIADMGSFEAAGRKLGSVQSGVSRHVRELESQFPRPLFDRVSRSARIRPAIFSASPALTSGRGPVRATPRR